MVKFYERHLQVTAKTQAFIGATITAFNVVQNRWGAPERELTFAILSTQSGWLVAVNPVVNWLSKVQRIWRIK
jgi:hypothetical protein